MIVQAPLFGCTLLAYGTCRARCARRLPALFPPCAREPGTCVSACARADLACRDLEGHLLPQGSEGGRRCRRTARVKRLAPRRRTYDLPLAPPFLDQTTHCSSLLTSPSLAPATCSRTLLRAHSQTATALARACTFVRVRTGVFTFITIRTCCSRAVHNVQPTMHVAPNHPPPLPPACAAWGV
ncbi:hypothetical protein EON67_05490 [archaeon]|nr:MAG: hypothetical protein EON67_05490 [archaeon]